MEHVLSKKNSALDMKSLVARAAEIWGNKTALVIDEFKQTLTFNELEILSNKIANFLIDNNIQYGDKVAVMLKNQAEFPLVWLAVSKIGAIMVPVNTKYQEYDANRIINHSEAKIVITTEEFLPLILNIQQKNPTIEKIISIGTSQNTSNNILNFHDLLQTASELTPTTPVFPETIINIQYTSGTTGNPKGCLLSHQYWITIAEQFTGSYVGLNEEDIMLTAQPFYYMDPQWNLLTALYSGAQFIMLDRFHPSSFMQKVREYQVTFFACLGVMPTLMLKMPPSLDDKNNHLRYVACAGIPAGIHQEIEERWGAPWYEIYGMTEAGGVTFVPQNNQKQLIGMNSIGIVDDKKEIQIWDEYDQPLKRGEIGELVIRGLGLMNGYYKDPKNTDIVFRGGWFHTGDLVQMDEQGFLYFKGRKKDIIRRSGENISASEVEDVLKLHKFVQNAACIPIPDDIRGEEVKIYIIIKQNYKLQENLTDLLITYCKEQLAYFKIPRYWEFVDKLPLTASEKVAKHELINQDNLLINCYDAVNNTWL